MTSTKSHAKKRASRQTAVEKRAATAAANRKAQLQWYAIGIGLAVTVAAIIVLISIYTEGELPIYGHG